MTTTWVIPELYRKRSQPYLSAFSAGDKKYGLPTGMLARIAYQESRYNKDARSPAGAIGLMQFMPATAKEFGIDPNNPFQSIDAAGRYLSQLYKQFGRWDLAVAAYNWGPGNVKKYGLAKAPDETRQYYVSVTRDVGVA